jgi:hypothetical protein
MMKRSSSYGYAYGDAAMASPAITDGFETDAFAPLWQTQTHSYPPSHQYQQPNQAGPSDYWGNSTGEKANQWAGFGGQSSAFGRPKQLPDVMINQQVQVNVQERQASEDTEDEDMMDMEDEQGIDDMIDCAEEEEDEQKVRETNTLEWQRFTEQGGGHESGRGSALDGTERGRRRM